MSEVSKAELQCKHYVRVRECVAMMQDLSCTYLAHHELASVTVTIIMKCATLSDVYLLFIYFIHSRMYGHSSQQDMQNRSLKVCNHG